MDKLQALFMEMVSYEKGEPARLQHFVKVHSFAKHIGTGEGLEAGQLYTLEAAALVHDIGIRPALAKYGSSAGKLQEQEGPALAEEMLRRLGFEEEVIARVSYLVGHHHTYTNVEGTDYRILLEADFLVNLLEEEKSRETILAAYENVFRTTTGKRICRLMFGL